MSKKRNITAYLAGPMEYAQSAGKHWRLRYKQELDKLGIDCIIPEFAEKFITDQAELNRLKKEDIPEYKRIMRQLIYLDLQFVEDVDIIITRWEGEPTSGTIGEAQHSHLCETPNYLVTSKPLTEVPGWFLACFDAEFSNLTEVIEHIKQQHL
jgi:hypothetical protein